MNATISAPHFVACIGFTNGRATQVPDNLKELTGCTVAQVQAYAERQHWKFKQNEE